MKPEERPEPTLSVHRVSLYFWLLCYWAWSHMLLFPDAMHTFPLWPSFLSTPAPKTVESSSVPSPSPVHSPAWDRLQLTAPPSPTAVVAVGEGGFTFYFHIWFVSHVSQFHYCSTSSWGMFASAMQTVDNCCNLLLQLNMFLV